MGPEAFCVSVNGEVLTVVGDLDLDLGGVKPLDSGAIGGIITAQLVARREGGDLRIVNPSTIARRVLDLMTIPYEADEPSIE